MPRWTMGACVLAWGLSLSWALAADFEVSVLKEGPPGDALAPAIVKNLSETGFSLKTGAGQPLCDIWVTKSWKAKAGFKSTSNLLYPFPEGSLIGAIRYHAGQRHSDFRQQRIRSGVYTIRFALQPEDGNHVGTSDTRDFLVLLKPEDDQAPEPIVGPDLFKKSALAAKTNHPCMLSLKAAEGAAPGPTLRHEEAAELWILRVPGSANVDGQTRPLSLDVVLIGHAAE